MSDENSPPKDKDGVAEPGNQPQAHDARSRPARNAAEASWTSIDNRFAAIRDQLGNLPSAIVKELAYHAMLAKAGEETVPTENTNTNTNSNANKMYMWMAMSVSISFCLFSLVGSAKLLGWI
ncbi:MAG: hypothetical protein ISN29_12525 [Gammaproteobacteria bacterium AqS3]|nr:hypothetical protein [Gammaproteobacteria bacterium AqS3]